MIYKEYGNTGIKVSAVGFGGMRFPDDPEKTVPLIRQAYEKGINYFDTAPLYIDGNSEKYFGEAFKSMKATRKEKPFYIATKSNKKTPGDVRRDLENSLKKLDVEQIDFYHVWCLLSRQDYDNRKAAGVLEEFRKIKEEGLVRHICMSSHMPGDSISDAFYDFPFEGVLLGYSPMNFSFREKAIETAGKMNKGVVVMNPLGGGIIPQNPERFKFVKRHTEESLVEGALRFLMSDQRITTALVGMSHESELHEAVQAADDFIPFSEQDKQKVKKGLSKSFNELCTQCGYCVKPCPQNIPIPAIMDAWNHYSLSGREDAVAGRLAFHWGISPDDQIWNNCAECGRCEKECTQALPIIKRFYEAKNLYKEWAEEQKRLSELEAKKAANQ